MSATVVPPVEIRQRTPLAPLTSLKVGGSADLSAIARGPAEAAALMRWCSSQGLSCRWLGGGSNLLVADQGLEGVAARYLDAQTQLLELGDETLVLSGAGRPLPSLARSLARAGWSDLEWAATVPGTVGGAVVNNAGAFGGCVAKVLRWAEVVNAQGEIERLTTEELRYTYRGSVLKRGEVQGVAVVRAAFAIRRAVRSETTARVDAFQRQRTASQPRQLSAGSVFANPPGDFAGRLIEAAGLKGVRRGAAEISAQHANFIVNRGGASAHAVRELVSLAQTGVWRAFEVWLQPEIELIGRWSEAELAVLRGPEGLT